ncbi:alpha-1,3-galactosyltransferase 2-like isoform 1-T2 [Menidia menidia]
MSGNRRQAGALLCFVLLVLGFISLHSRHLQLLSSLANIPEPPRLLRSVDDLDEKLDFGSRPAVETKTSWNASIIWELMFDPKLYDQVHRERNTSVALTVFAVGRYLDAYLHTFLVSAEKHFMLGFPVTYYVFTDSPAKVAKVELAPERKLVVVQVERQHRWQDISMMRMKTISEIIETELEDRFDYVFCFDVDQEFTGRFGSETLGESVALLHAHYYKLPKHMFTYDRNPKSKAFLEEGDYYYHAAIFGGSLEKVKALVDFCFMGIMDDKLNDVEALWHDESHLNKFFWLHKPTKLLSPEFCWDPSIGDSSDILIRRLIWAPKHYDTLRTP